MPNWQKAQKDFSIMGEQAFFLVNEQQAPMAGPGSAVSEGPSAAQILGCHWQGRMYTSDFQQKIAGLQAYAQIENAIALTPSGTSSISALQLLPGEFACWIEAPESVLFFNDQLGRLPVYACRQNGRLLMGRNLPEFRKQVPLTPNPVGIAQTFWAGYALGSTSMYKELEVVPPGSIWLIEKESGKHTILNQTVAGYSPRNTAPMQVQAKALAEQFLSVCQQMAAIHPHWHLSLSGGQDARAVLSGFAKATPHLSASSFTMGKGFADAIIAEQLAAQYHLPWQAFTVAPTTDDDWLIQAKAGFNYAGMAFIKPYLEQVAAAYRQHIMLTGDGGDKMLPYLGEPTAPTSLDDLVEKLLVRHAIVPAALAAKAAGLHRDELAQSVYECVAAYPEHSLNDRSIHFVLSERARRAYFEGEDRNRLFMWSTTPFYHPDFVQMAMQVPDEYKKRYRFYHAFMQELDASLQTIPDANGHRLGSVGFAAQKWMQEQFRSGPVWLKNMLRQINAVRSGNSTAASKLKIELPSALSFMPDSTVQQIWQTSEEAAWHLRTIAKVFR